MIFESLKRSGRMAAGVSMALLLLTARVAAADDPLPVPWNGIDIGGPSPVGFASANNGVFTLTGGGGALASTRDQFHFVYQSLTGDCALVARVSGNTENLAGLMARQALEAGSDFVAVTLAPGGVSSVYRTLYAPQAAAVTAPSASPVWIKLVKRGTNMQSFMAADRGGAPGAWKTVGSRQPIPSGMIYVGLCQATGSQGGTATFDHVSLTTGPQLLFDNGVYTISPIGAPNMVLVPSGASIKLASSNDSASQKWRLTSKGGLYSFQSVSDPTRVLSVPGAKTESGSPVAASPDLGQDTQRWTIAAGPSGTYNLLPQFNSGIGLDDFQGSGSPDAVIDIWSFSSTDPHLQWLINSAE